jgi:hypothetical protein
MLAAAALVVPAAAWGTTKHRLRTPTCPPPHSYVVLADRTAAVFQLEDPATDFIRQAACSHASRKPFVMKECDNLDCEGPSFSGLTLAGDILAYQRYEYTGSSKYMDATPASWLVQVRDLRTHRLIHSSPTSTSEPPPSKVIGNGPTEGIVVKPDGAVAWIAVDGSHPYSPSLPPTVYQVWKIDRTGRHLLAMGPQIAPSSIALSGNTVYWTDGGAPASAPLY